jgi:hypothetical protein
VLQITIVASLIYTHCRSLRTQHTRSVLFVILSTLVVVRLCLRWGVMVYCVFSPSRLGFFVVRS